MITDSELLEAALVGLKHTRSAIEVKMAELRRQIGGRDSMPGVVGLDLGGARVRRKRLLSADARRRIAAGQRKRWAAFRKKRAAEK